MGMYDSWSQPNQYNRQPYNGYGQMQQPQVAQNPFLMVPTIAAQAQRINQLELQSQMTNVVRYPNGYTYNAGPSPFCGCNGCGNI